MAFTSAFSNDIDLVGSGERYGSTNISLNATVFEDGLKIGRFAKIDTGSIDNMDGSATPVLAGVVLRTVSRAVEDAGVVDKTLYDQVEYIRSGLVTVDVKTGETPSVLGRVYVSNAGDANDGLATANAADVEANATFVKEVKSGVWLILQNSTLGDFVSAAAGKYVPALIADPGDAGAIPADQTGNIAITTAGAETRTLAVPGTAGLVLAISMDVDGGDGVITVAAAFNQTGNNTITLNDAGDTVVLTSVQVGGSLVWRVVSNDGATLATV